MEPGSEIWEMVFVKSEQVVYRKIADETLLVPIRGKLANMERIFALNSVAEYIWENLDGKKRLKEIRNDLLAEFEVEQKQANADILEFIGELRNAELIQRTE